MFFEIEYGKFITDNESRNTFISNFILLNQVLKGKNIIISSGAENLFMMRNPEDIITIMETIFDMKKHGIKIYATNLKTNKTIYDVDYKKSAVIIGNEANGVSREMLELSDEFIKIPMKGKTESLNAAVATGVVLYEYVRQKLK